MPAKLITQQSLHQEIPQVFINQFFKKIPALKLGFLLICSYLGGAIAVNLVGQLHSPWIPGLILALFWVGIFLKKPNLFGG